MVPNRPNPQRTPPANPRKVRGGVKYTRAGTSFPENWVAQHWARIAEHTAPPGALAEGLQYARLGQTRALTIEPGAVRASVQGRNPRAYDVALRLPEFTHDQWESLVAACIEQPVFAARLLAGEVPQSLDDMLTRRGLGLLPELPVSPEHLRVSCTCADAARAGGWCKHICCAAYIAAERFAADPFLGFTLRGLPRDEVVERIRQRRQASEAGAGGAPVYAAHVPGLSDAPARPLADCVDRFWDTPPNGAGAPDLPLAPPEVSHPLLRRLGPSPFAAADAVPGRTPAKFPLVGLLATCYEVASESILRAEQSDPGAPPADDGAPADAPSH